MRYIGGKARVAKRLGAFLNSQRQPDQLYLEPFVGAGWVMAEVQGGRRIGGDASYNLIHLWGALQRGWIPPGEVSEELYAFAKNTGVFSALQGFIGIGASFGGKWFGGYARDPKTDRNYSLNAQRSLLKILPRLRDVHFAVGDYRAWSPSRALVYCDPPYEGTTQAYGVPGRFVSSDFWDTVRLWSRDNAVFVSEYSAPDDFKVVWEVETKTDLEVRGGGKGTRVEKLFQCLS